MDIDFEKMTDGKSWVYPGDFDDCRGSLTKREYFAALAMQAVLSRRDIRDEMHALKPDDYDAYLVYVSRNSVRHADALIEALNK